MDQSKLKPMALAQWQQCKCKEDAVNWHLKHTPFLGPELIKVLVDSYDKELTLSKFARKKEKRKKTKL